MLTSSPARKICDWKKRRTILGLAQIGNYECVTVPVTPKLHISWCCDDCGTSVFGFSVSVKMYRKDRFKNLVFLSPSLCTKWSILFGQEKLDRRCVNRCQASKLGFISWDPNKHQLLHRVASIKTPLIYNSISQFSCVYVCVKRSLSTAS